jgi:hypothetical protein
LRWFRLTGEGIVDFIESSSSWLWELLEGAKQLSAESTALPRNDVMREHPLFFHRGRTFVEIRVGHRPHQPPIRIKAEGFS